MPQNEAINILAEIVNELTASAHDIKSVLRKCQHVCELLGWETQKSWFHQELNGYDANSPLPAYRSIPAQRIWEPGAEFVKKVYWQTDMMFGNISKEDAFVENVTIDIRAGIDWLLGAAKGGYRNPLGETKEGWLRSKKITLQRVEVSPPTNFSQLIAEIEKGTFDFISRAYAQLRYGNILGDIWADYRRKVDAALQSLNLGKHLDVIKGGLTSDNPELWRTAIYECRSIFEDLADYLWQDQRKTYKYLPGLGPDGKPKGELAVTKKDYKNRLRAYIHQKGLGEKYRKFIQDEVDRLATSISSLISLQSRAHRKMGKQDAQSIAIATYYVLGELVTRTDMQPVKEYTEPAKGIEISIDD